MGADDNRTAKGAEAEAGRRAGRLARGWRSLLRSLTPVRPLLPWLLSAALVALFLRTFSPADAWAQAKAAHATPLALAALANILALNCRSVAWGSLLAPEHRVSWWRLSRYGVVAAAVSTVVPARAGELVRLRLLQCRDGVAPAMTVSTALAEKVLDALALFLLAAPLPWLLPNLPAWVGRSVGIGLAIGVVLLVLLVAVARRFSRGSSTAAARRFGPWLGALARPPGRLAAAFALVAASWQAEIWVVQAVLAAVSAGEPLGWPAAMTVLLAINLAIAVPSTPGHVGVLEAGAMAGLHLFHLPQQQCLGFVVLYRLVQLIPIMGLSALDMRLVLTGLTKPPSGR